MVKNEMKAALSIMGTVFVPFLVHADQPRDDTSSMSFSIQETKQGQKPGYLSGEKVRTDQIPGLYNQSGAYACADPWDVSFTADYIYWKWQQDALQIGTYITANSTILEGFSGNFSNVFQNPGYTSGFQAGMGVNLKGMDDWQLYSEYTWYHNTNNQSFTGTSSNPIVLVYAAYRADQSRVAEADVVGTLNTQAKLSFQALDFLVQRPFYFGKKLTANFAAGLRTQWITQRRKMNSPSLTNNEDGLETTNFASSSKLTSWSLGPKAALDSNWLLGCGFKIMSNIAQSVLYTSYNTKANESGTLESVETYSGSEKGLHNYGTLRPVTETFLGLGWGSYFCGNRAHIDLSIGYDFDVYWDYNMLYATTSQTIGNMYLHGANVQLRFDF
jgi:hypothetical protein